MMSIEIAIPVTVTTEKLQKCCEDLLKSDVDTITIKNNRSLFKRKLRLLFKEETNINSYEALKRHIKIGIIIGIYIH